MERFFKRKLPCDNTNSGDSSRGNPSNNISQGSQPSSIPTPITIDLSDLPWDPADRPRILDYHPNQREEIRRLYWARGACQPRGHNFPKKIVGAKLRQFVVTWFDEFHWLEYSVKNDKAFCLCCYLFRDFFGHQGGSETFVSTGFDSWSKKSSFKGHMGNIDSFHNKALQKCENLMRQNQSIAVALHKQTEAEKKEYRIRLLASISCCRFLLKNGLPFRGHDESEYSISRGLFFETLDLLRENNESIHGVTLKNAPKNHQLTSPKIQKDIIECFSLEILKSICEDIGTDVFALLVDESSDVSKKEQMAVVLRYVDKLGIVKESFVGVLHVTNTSSLTLKVAIDDVAKKHDGVKDFFDMLATVTNVVCASCKRKDIMRESHKERVQAEIDTGERDTGKGLNQELSLTRAGDTRWGSHYKTITGLMNLFPEVINVLKYVEEEGATTSNRNQAYGVLSYFKTLDFVFYLHLMLHILCVTNVLSQHLQMKDQDILEAVSLVKGTKEALKTFRENGFDSFLKKVNSFCQAHDIQMLEMKDCYVTSRNRRTNITNRHHFEVDIYNTVLDMQIQEFNDRFSEVNTELLENMAALSPCDLFSTFDVSKLLKFSEMYPNDFTNTERLHLSGQLEVYYQIVHNDVAFAGLNGIADLARVMVETKKHVSFPLVYRLLKLALVLPVSTATVERCFSKMKLIKSNLRNTMSDDLLNWALICAIEKEEIAKVTNEAIIDRFQRKKDRRGQL